MNKENQCIGLIRRLVRSITYFINYELELRLIWSTLKMVKKVQLKLVKLEILSFDELDLF